MELPSVTQILAPHSDFSQVPAHILVPAQDRGDLVHELCALCLQRLWIPEVPDACAGYFASFKDWRDRMVIETILVEAELRDEKRGYCGHPDAILRLRGDQGLTLMDWKSGRTSSKTWLLQISAYRKLAIQNGYPISRVAVLQPHPEGKIAKFTEFTGAMEYGFAIFLAELSVWKYFNG